jgi:hypothetical protein
MFAKQLVLNHLTLSAGADARFAREFWLSRWAAADPQNMPFYQSQWLMPKLPKHLYVSDSHNLFAAIALCCTDRYLLQCRNNPSSTNQSYASLHTLVGVSSTLQHLLDHHYRQQ